METHKEGQARVGRGDVWVSLWEFIGSSQAELGEEAGHHTQWVKLQVIFTMQRPCAKDRYEAESAVRSSSFVQEVSQTSQEAWAPSCKGPQRAISGLKQS